MNKFNASGCCGFFAIMGQSAQIASIASNPLAVKGILEACSAGQPLQEEFPQSRVEDICTELSINALGYCIESDLPESAKLIRHITETQFTIPPVRNSELQWTIAELQRLMRSEMADRLFFCISEPSAKTFDDPYPMMKEVDSVFPQARYDIKEAYNSWVLDRNTAAVFHAMRVAEHGLRFLAKRLKVQLTHKGQPQTIESATWDKIITAIKNKINAAHSMPHGKRRQKQLNYYSDMADRCSYMKDLWRNDIMHTRVSFNHPEALGTLQRVAGFMQLLATKGSA